MKFSTISKDVVLEQFNKLPKGLSSAEILKRLQIKPFLTEATFIAPSNNAEIEAFSNIFDKKVPSAIAVFLISDVLNDDDLNSQLVSLSNTDPYADSRELIFNWVNTNMPHILKTGEDITGQMSLLGNADFS